ncbi:MAG: DUF2764 family protein [Bacteroidales bacterium]|nr:DUF2764 family protein [Bacteroidales bacterium]
MPELILNSDNKGFNYDAVRESVYNSSEDKDRRFIEWFDFGTQEENLTPHFYKAAMKSKNNFIRKYFALDLEIRNRKVDFIAEKLGKEADGYKVLSNMQTDLELSEAQLQRLSEIFANKNILEKEQQLDKFKWDFITDLNPYGVFNMDIILAFLAKGKLIDRWNKLDSEAGREMFRKLVDEVRGTFKGIENKTIE